MRGEVFTSFLYVLSELVNVSAGVGYVTVGVLQLHM